MIDIELWSAPGFVAVVDLPPHQRVVPEVVVWGARMFKLVEQVAVNWNPPGRPRYVEVVPVAILTPSPGRPLNAEGSKP